MPALVGRIGDGLQLRAGVSAPDGLEPSRYVLFPTKVLINYVDSDEPHVFHGFNDSLRRPKILQVNN